MCMVDYLFYPRSSRGAFGDLHMLKRSCASRDEFDKIKRDCDRMTILTGSECTVAMCEESGCRAELPVHKPGRDIDMLWLN